MMPLMQCRRCGKPVMREGAALYEYRVRTFLFWTWIERVRAGYLVRCTTLHCGRDWRVGLDGVHEVDPRAVSSMAAPRIVEPEANGRPEREREEREPAPPLGLAVRRPEL